MIGKASLRSWLCVWALCCLCRVLFFSRLGRAGFAGLLGLARGSACQAVQALDGWRSTGSSVGWSCLLAFDCFSLAELVWIGLIWASTERSLWRFHLLDLVLLLHRSFIAHSLYIGFLLCLSRLASSCNLCLRYYCLASGSSYELCSSQSELSERIETSRYVLICLILRHLVNDFAEVVDDWFDWATSWLTNSFAQLSRNCSPNLFQRWSQDRSRGLWEQKCQVLLDFRPLVADPDDLWWLRSLCHCLPNRSISILPWAVIEAT